MDEQSINDIITKGETTTVEFKSWIKADSMKERINLAVSELIAFANSKGGTVYLGIEDNGDVTGCFGKYDLQNICESIYDKTRPPMFTDIEELEYQGKKIIAISVMPDGNTYATTDGRCLKRLGKNSKPYYPDEMSHIYSTSQTPDFSSQIIAESSVEDINLMVVYSLKEKLKIRDADSTLPELDDMAFLKDLGLTAEDNGQVKLTIADFSEKVFQEALLNALSHRDYQQLGAVYVKHYPDKIVIENPGGFLEGITEKNIITHPSAPRNKLIAETLQRLKYVQRTGQGVDIIFREMVSMGKPYPVYRVFNDAVQLTIANATEYVDFVKFIVNEQDTKQIFLSLSELMILRYVADNKQIKLDKAQELTQVSEDEVRKSLANLIKYGLLETSGKDYMLTARVYEAVKSDIEYTRDKTIQYIRAKEMVLEYLKRNGSIKNSIIRELCGFTKQQARATIDKMIAENLIFKVGAGSATEYKLK